MKNLQNIALVVLVVLAAAGVYLLNGIDMSLKEVNDTCQYPTNTLSITYDENGASFTEAQERYTADKKKTLEILSAAGVIVKSSDDTVRYEKSGHTVTSQEANYLLEGQVEMEIVPSDKIFEVIEKLADSDIDASYSTVAASDDCVEVKSDQPPAEKKE